MAACNVCATTVSTRQATRVADFAFVGNGKGAYEQVDDFDFVGEGRGAWQRGFEVQHYGWKPKWITWILCGVVPLIASCLILRGCLSGDDRGRYADEEDDPKYDCTIEGPSKGRLLLEAVWQNLDTNGDGRIPFGKMKALADAGRLSQTALSYVSGADVNGDGALSRGEFFAALGRAGLASAPASLTGERRQAKIFAQAAWLVADTDMDGRVTYMELQSMNPPGEHPASADLFGALEVEAGPDGLAKDGFTALVEVASEAPVDAPPPESWSEGQRIFCCAAERAGCLSAPDTPTPPEAPTSI